MKVQGAEDGLIVLTNDIKVLTNSITVLTYSMIVLTQSIIVLTQGIIVQTQGLGYLLGFEEGSYLSITDFCITEL